MGGHGGLNILPQKRWNVYNYDNREKVRQDEEAAAKEEQLKQEQARKRDAEFRLERLRRAKGLPDHKHAEPHSPSLPDESGSNHINLFEGLKDFKFGAKNDVQCSEVQKEGSHSQKRRKTEEKAKVILPEDEKYRLGYGLVGRGVQEPWYLSRAFNGTDDKAGASSAVSDSQRNGKILSYLGTNNFGYILVHLEGQKSFDLRWHLKGAPRCYKLGKKIHFQLCGLAKKFQGNQGSTHLEGCIGFL